MLDKNIYLFNQGLKLCVQSLFFYSFSKFRWWPGPNLLIYYRYPTKHERIGWNTSSDRRRWPFPNYLRKQWIEQCEKREMLFRSCVLTTNKVVINIFWDTFMKLYFLKLALHINFPQMEDRWMPALSVTYLHTSIIYMGASKQFLHIATVLQTWKWFDYNLDETNE